MLDACDADGGAGGGGGGGGGGAASPGLLGRPGGVGGHSGGRFDFDDGGSFCGGWEEGKAHGYGVCTGPKGQGVYAGAWHYGFEVSGVYTWPSGSTYAGLWQNGRRHGLGVESRGKWLYKGEWSQGFKGRYGLRQSIVSTAKYQGTWANGLQDGYGSEVYADTGTYQGQWLRGMRHGYGVRTSAPFGVASQYPKARLAMSNEAASVDVDEASTSTATPATAASTSKTRLSRRSASEEESATEMRGGFVLRSRSDEFPQRRRSLGERSGMRSIVQNLKLKKQRSTGDIDRKGVSSSIRSTGSTTSWMSAESAANLSARSEASSHSFVLEEEHLDASVTETYMGEWKNDRRTGFGVCERSDGLRYEGEWYNNRKYGYGVTSFGDGSKEEGKYKNNQLISSSQRRHLFLIRSAKFRERIDSAINAAQRASKIATQKADIAMSRTATARGKADHADVAKEKAMDDADMAETCARRFAGDPSREPSPAVKAVDVKASANATEMLNMSKKAVVDNTSVPNKGAKRSIFVDEHKKPNEGHKKFNDDLKKFNDDYKKSNEKFIRPMANNSIDLVMPKKSNVFREASPSPKVAPSKISSTKMATDKEMANRSTSGRSASGRSASASRGWMGETGSRRPPLERQLSDPRRMLADRMDHYRRSTSREPSMEPKRRTTVVDVHNHPVNNLDEFGMEDVKDVDDALRRRHERRSDGMTHAQKRKRSLGQGRSTRVELHDTASQTVIADVRVTNVTPLVRPTSMSNDRRRNSIDALRSPGIVSAESKDQPHTPLVNLVSPRAQALVSRQQLMIFVLLVNLSLAVLFFKLLT